jgi:hypothetical protein
MQRPEYLALNEYGLEYSRLALIVGELPLEARAAALVEATSTIAIKTGLVAVKRIPFGAPVFTAFADMNRPKAKHHAESKLLLVTGDDVPLSYCPSYD